MKENAARTLATRLRSGIYTETDFELAVRAVEQFGVPIGEVRRIRDESFRSYRSAAYPDVVSIREQARLVHRDLTRYASSAWRKDQHAVLLPPRLWGKPKAFLWEALKHGPVLGFESLRDILR